MAINKLIYENEFSQRLEDVQRIITDARCTIEELQADLKDYNIIHHSEEAIGGFDEYELENMASSLSELEEFFDNL